MAILIKIGSFIGWWTMVSLGCLIVYLVIYYVMHSVNSGVNGSTNITEDQIDKIRIILRARRIEYQDFLDLCNERFRKRYGIKELVGSLADLTEEEAQKFIDSYKGTIFNEPQKVNK